MSIAHLPQPLGPDDRHCSETAISTPKTNRSDHIVDCRTIPGDQKDGKMVSWSLGGLIDCFDANDCDVDTVSMLRKRQVSPKSLAAERGLHDRSGNSLG